MSIGIAVVGVGKIARDRHIPTIAADPRFTLAGVVSPHAVDVAAPVFATIADLRAALPDVAALAICTPPIGRLALVEQAFAHGFDVLLEKPPAATVSEAERFAPLARAGGRALYLAWHSREAAAVGQARAWLGGRAVRRVRIDWLEDVRVWHPGQDWIWSAGVGVFDPGVNALSILTALVAAPRIVRAELDVPAGRAAPIAARLALESAGGCAIDATFSFDQRGPQTWSMTIDTDDGVLTLLDGGRRMRIDGVDRPAPDVAEYVAVYDRFAALIAARGIDADLAPLLLVADAFMVGERRSVDRFDW